MKTEEQMRAEFETLIIEHSSKEVLRKDEDNKYFYPSIALAWVIWKERYRMSESIIADKNAEIGRLREALERIKYVHEQYVPAEHQMYEIATKALEQTQ